MPSNELFSEVLGVEILDCRVVGNGVAYNAKDNYPTQSINIYEIAHKCKEWALRKGFEVRSSSMLNSDEGMRYWTQLRDVHGNDSLRICTVYADTEPEAIFKACEWILKNLK